MTFIPRIGVASLLCVLALPGPARAQKVYYYTWGQDATLFRANPDGTNIETIAVGPVGGGLALDNSGCKLYWDYVSGGLDPLLTSAADGSCEATIASLDNPAGIALDAENGKLYLTAGWNGVSGSGKIIRIDVDGKNAETLISGLDATRGIALDADGGKVYWTEMHPVAGNDGVRRAGLDGADVEDVVVGVSTPSGIIVDARRGKMYWSSRDGRGLHKANLDGTDVEEIPLSFPILASDNWGLGFDSDNCHIYFGSPSGEPTIIRVSCDGSSVEVTPVPQSPSGVVYDPSPRCNTIVNCESLNVPATSTVGLAVLIASLLGAGMVMSKKVAANAANQR